MGDTANTISKFIQNLSKNTGIYKIFVTYPSHDGGEKSRQIIKIIGPILVCPLFIIPDL